MRAKIKSYGLEARDGKSNDLEHVAFIIGECASSKEEGKEIHFRE